MKKIFTLLAGVLFALGAQAQTLVDFEQRQDYGIELSGSTTIANVKLKANTLSTPGIKFDGSYQKDGAMTDKYAVLTTDGGFKAGDVVTIAGAFNNTDETKEAGIDLFTVEGTTPTVLFNSGLFINGRTVEDMPTPVTYTLTADVEKLYIGRNGNTATYVTTLKVVRGGTETDITEPDPVLPPTEATRWDFTVTSDAAIAALEADANWVYDSENSRYSYDVETPADQLIAITANGATLDGFEGIKVGRSGGKFAAKSIRVDVNNRLQMNASNAMLALENLAKDDIVYIEFATASDEERKFDVTNGEGENLTSSNKEDRKVGKITVTNNGTLTLTQTKAINIYNLYINPTEVPEVTTGISVLKAETVEGNGVIYNLQGQRVDANYRGVVIKNGRKVVNK